MEIIPREIGPMLFRFESPDKESGDACNVVADSAVEARALLSFEEKYFTLVACLPGVAGEARMLFRDGDGLHGLLA